VCSLSLVVKESVAEPSTADSPSDQWSGSVSAKARLEDSNGLILGVGWGRDGLMTVPVKHL